MSQVNRGHLAGLELAMSSMQRHLAHDNVKILHELIAQASAAPEQEPVALQHMAVAEDGELRWMTGRKVDNCELYAMPDFGRAPSLYAHADPSEVEQLRESLAFRGSLFAKVEAERNALRRKLADAHSAAGGLQDLCRFLAASYCELDELRYTTAKLPADQIRDFLIGNWPVIQGTANQMNIKRISGQPYDQVGALQGIIAMLATAQPAECETCNGSQVVATTDKDHEGNTIECRCPICAQQPAGVAVPGWLVSPHGESAVRLSNVLFGSVCFSEEEADGRMAVLLEFLRAMRAMLAAAPHPVSGEQKHCAFDKDLAMHLLSEAHGFASVSPRGKDNIAAVMEMIERIDAPPAAQDVAGLVGALDKILECFPLGLDRHVFRINGGQPLQADGDTEFLSYKKVNAALGLIRQLASDALAAHRAQQAKT